jgi:hypothetical protein
MLASDESAPAQPPIKYNCPKCKKPLEAPAEMAGTKRNCPYCDQRLQIPAAPRNKTMLASDESAAPAGAAPVAYAAGGARGSAPVPAPGGPAPAPAGAWAAQLTPRNIALAIGALLALWIVLSWIKGPPQIRDADKEAQLAKELERIRGEIELKKQELRQQFQAQQDADRRHDERLAAADEAKRDADRDYRARLQSIGDQKVKDEMDRQHRKELQQQQEDREKMERKHQDELDEFKKKLDASQKAVDEAERRHNSVQAQPTYIAPPIWHPRYYWWW